ncbi:MAG: helix-turn-helix domain-containing protein [Phycisphaeraceae bacterium]|nr:helix-turn-helix domain-containing protein [Phycisphaeraceae bacterium]MCW5755018.1 helix-turn-helix domain-containing protein [Phycisphaeraceae bacterium]
MKSEERAGEDVGALIRASREARGWTLQHLAERVGCARSYLSLVENGRKGPPGDDLLRALEGALSMSPGVLIRAAHRERLPADMRRDLEQTEQRERMGRRLAELLLESGGELDALHRSGELRRLVDALHNVEGEMPAWVMLPAEVPVINKVAAGYPSDFTDLGYPARIADEYIRCPDVHDPDAFACRVVGDSMLPEYREGDIVVFSPLRDVQSGMDCFVRLEPDHESTFKRVYFERGAGGEELIRLQPTNSAYPPRVVGREEVAGLYAAVSVMRRL